MLDKEILEKFRGKRVLITGGTGLIGRQVVDILCGAGADVIIVSLDNVKVHEDALHLYGDLTEFKYCREITADMDFVFHLAGIKGSIEVTKSKPASFFAKLLPMNP